MTVVSRALNVLRYGIYNKVFKPSIRYKQYAFDYRNVNKLQEALSKFDTKAVVAFIGLRQLKYSLGFDDPYIQTRDLLTEVYDSLIVPTFTPSVRISGFYDPMNSPSEVGVFSELFRTFADYRTLSPLKSYAVKGDISNEFRKLQYLDDFSKNGAFEFIVDNQITSINIGTNDLRFSCIHFAEFLSHVPYQRQIKREVSIKNENGDVRKIVIVEPIYKKIRYKLNLRKIERDLEREKLIIVYKINNMIIRVLPQQKYFNYILKRLSDNPYYLVD